MISLTVLYPKTVDSHFDMDYYLNTHTPLVRDRFTPLGLTGVDLQAGMAGMTPDSPAVYAMICQLQFTTVDELQTAIDTHGPEVTGDIPNFTNVQPLMQITQAV